MDAQLVNVGRALACPVRVALMQVLGEDGMALGKAAEMVGVAPSTAHYHFEVLLDAGLVMKRGRRRGCTYRWPEARWELVCRRAPGETAAGTK